MVTLVTGGTGFVGSSVVRALQNKGHQVRVLVRSGCNDLNLKGLGIQVQEGDLTDSVSLEKAVAGCQYVFHVAADYRLWVPDPSQMYRINVQGTENLLRIAKKHHVEKIVYTSSVATLSLRNDGQPSCEKDIGALDEMIGHYKRSKFLAEQQVNKLVNEEEIPVVIVNPSTPIGPRDIKPTPTGKMVLDAARGKVPAFVDTGLNVVHVEDVAMGHVLALEKGEIGHRYVLGGENLSLKEIFSTIAQMTDQKPPKIQLPPTLLLPLAHMFQWVAKFNQKEPLVTVDGVKLARKKMYFSCNKAKQLLGYRPRPAQEALKDAIDWFLSHPKEIGLMP